MEKTGVRGEYRLLRFSKSIHVPSLLWSRWREIASSSIFHLFISGLIIVVVFARPPAVFSGDTDTARNYCNTIVSSLSTILALCISIILVAIQLTASNYTHRVLDFFVRLPYNVSLFLIYLVTIMHSFFLMAKIQDTKRDPLSPQLLPEMSADLVLVVICFLSLLLYMYAVVQLLKPERIIELILRDYQKAATTGKWRSALDNVEQICDIAKRAASVSDSVTATLCLQAMLEIAAKLPLPVDADDPVLNVHQSFLDQWGEIVGVAVKEKETGLLLTVFGALYAQGRIYIDGGSWLTAELVVKAYKHLVFGHLLPDGQAYYTENVAERLYTLAAHAARMNVRGRQFAIRSWRVIQTIGESAFNLEANASTLLTGFLMVKEIPDTLHSLESSEKDLAEGLTIHFELFKAVASCAKRRDAARWAEWWAQELSQTPVFERGQALAWLLARHLERPDIVETLEYVWHKEQRDFDFSFLSTGPYQRTELFDGWPWAHLLVQVKPVHSTERL